MHSAYDANATSSSKTGSASSFEATEPQRFRLKLGEDGSKMAALAAKRGTLEVWATNKTHHFRRQPDAILARDGSIELTVGVDAIVTVTTGTNT